MIPLIFVSMSVYFAKDDKFFMTEVNNPATKIIMPCPKENKNNIIAEYTIFAVIEAVAIIPAKIGVEHGVVAKAKTNPNKNG